MLISDLDMRALARAEGVREVALQDCILQYDDTEPFVSYLKRVKPDKPHWFAEVAPDTVEHAALTSLSAQGAYAQEHGVEACRELLASQGLKLGQVKKAAKAEPTKGENNPYARDVYLKSHTEAQRQAHITSLITKAPTIAAQLSRSAHRTIDDQPEHPVGAARMQR